jgi:TolB-like protein/Tfp pilus assembly protein PilF
VSEGAGAGSGRATGVPPGALTALLAEVAAAPERQEAQPQSLPPGTIVGRFEISRELGRGGFGVVYEARDRDLGRQVALKIVRPGRVTEEEGKVVREAEAIARLTHPNLITLYDVGRSEGGPYLVFELLRGKTLEARMDDGQMPVQEAVHVATEVARGLAHAHAEGVVHRDLKPSNVFVTNKGHVKILDFGMAHAFGRRRLSGGTPAYMAPEQWEDDPEDERTDVFALGVMLHRMLSGEYPFPEGEGRWAAEPATARKLDVPGAPGLAGLLERMLDRTPKGRPRDGAAVLATLAPIEDALRAKPADGTAPVHASRRKATLGELLAGLKRRPVFRLLVPLAVAAGVLAIAAAGAGAWHAWRRAAEHRLDPGAGDAKPSVAVLSFADLSPGHDQEYLADGVAEEVLNGLAQVDGLRVVGRSTAFSYKGKGKKVEEIGKELGVGSVLEGSVRRSGDKVRITAQLVRASDASTIWSQSFDRSLSDVFAVQEEIGSAVVEALAVRLVPGRTLARSGGSSDPEALQLYLRGRDQLRRGGQDVQLALGSFEKAVKVDPRFALAWVGIADAIVTLEATSSVEPNEARARRKRAREAADKAVGLAPGLADSFRARADVRQWLEADWRGQGEDLERARALAPGDGAVAQSRGWHLLALGRTDESVAEFERATRIDPLAERGWVNGWLGLAAAFYGKRDHASSRRAARRAEELFPGFRTFAMATIGLDHIIAGEAQQAIEIAQALRRMGPDAVGWDLMLEALAYHALDRPEEARRARAEIERAYGNTGGPYQVAELHAWFGDADRAFAWLEKALALPDTAMFWLKTDPLLDGIRGDPRWPALLERAGLPPDAVGKGTEAPAPASPAPSIAVLPFADMSPKHDQEYFADGVAEEIRNALAKVRRLKVIGRTSSFSFKGRNEDLRAIGQKLGARHLLEGSVRKAGARVRITAQLVEAQGGSQVWSETFDRKVTDVFAVQQEIAQSVASALQASLVPAGANRTTTPEAYDQYLRGRRLLDSSGPEGIRAAVAAFQRAVALDPDYAPAHVRLSEAYGAAAGYLADTPDEVMRDARLAVASADRAITLDPQGPDGYAARASARVAYLWDWKGGLEDIERAAALGSGDKGTNSEYALTLARMGRLPDGIAAAKRATGFDPLSPGPWRSLGILLGASGDVAGGAEPTRRCLQLSPDDPVCGYVLALTLLDQGKVEESLAQFQRQRYAWIRLTGTAIVQHRMGHARESQAALDELVAQHGSTAYQVAQVHAGRGERDAAFEWLERARLQHDPGLMFVRFDWVFRNLWAEPRWNAFLKRMNLPVD